MRSRCGLVGARVKIANLGEQFVPLFARSLAGAFLGDPRGVAQRLLELPLGRGVERPEFLEMAVYGRVPGAKAPTEVLQAIA